MAQNLPHVHIITTGGTIAATPSGMLTPTGLLATIPDLAALAELTVEPLLDIGSSWITPAHWMQLSEHINTVCTEQDDLSGIVITHGTDTLEETAYFLHLTHHFPCPVVLTGAMRSAQELSADGPANLRAAIVLAATASTHNHGVVAVLNNEIFAARHVTKAHTQQVDAFTGGKGGTAGTIYGNKIQWLQASNYHPSKRLRIDPAQSPPRVDIIYSYAGADGALISAAVATGAQGVVMASFGGGRLSAGQIEGVQRAMQQGVAVVLSSRVGSGSVEENYRDNLAASPEEHGVILAGDLSPAKARILLMLALMERTDLSTIGTYFANA